MDGGLARRDVGPRLKAEEADVRTVWVNERQADSKWWSSLIV